MKKKTGIQLIESERQKQIDSRGLEHDLQHVNDELSYNAAILASPVIFYEFDRSLANQIVFQKAALSSDWNLPYQATEGNVLVPNHTLDKKERIEQLIVAGALIAAEIDRLNHPDNN